jgi:fibronectin type III domain protein
MITFYARHSPSFGSVPQRRSDPVSSDVHRGMVMSTILRHLLSALGLVALITLAACQQSVNPEAALSVAPNPSGAQTVDSIKRAGRAPSVTLTATPTTIISGNSSMLTWNARHGEACIASGGWSGSMATSGTWSTGALPNSTNYELTCTNGHGSAMQTVTVTVTAPTPAVPTISFSDSPSTIASGSASILTWSSINATACTASGGWSGTLATSGSQSTGALSASTTYTLSCTGTGGSASQSANVTVTPVTTGTAILTWDPPTTNTDGSAVTPLAGYTIYYGTSANALTQSVVITDATTTTSEITGLASGTWYFAVAAAAADGTQSALSNLGSKAI